MFRIRYTQELYQYFKEPSSVKVNVKQKILQGTASSFEWMRIDHRQGKNGWKYTQGRRRKIWENVVTEDGWNMLEVKDWKTSPVTEKPGEKKIGGGQGSTSHCIVTEESKLNVIK